MYLLSLRHSLLSIWMLCSTMACVVVHNKAEAQQADFFRTLLHPNPALPSGVPHQAIDDALNKINQFIDLNPDSARKAFLQLAGYCQRIQYHRGYAMAIKSLGWCAIRSGDYKGSLQYYQKAGAYADQYSIDMLSRATIYSEMGIPHYYMGLYDSMAYYSYKATQLTENYALHIDDEAIELISIYNTLSSLWLTMNHAAKSKFYLEKARVICIAHRDSVKLAYNMVNTGYVCLLEHKVDSALYYFNLPMGWPSATADVLAHAHVGIGKTYLRMREPQASVPFLKKAVSMATISKQIPIILDASYTLGESYYKSKQYSLAIVIFEATLKQARTLQLMHTKSARITYLALAKIYAQTGDYKAAFLKQQQAYYALDSLREKEQFLAVSEMEAKYQTATKDKQLAENKLLISEQKGHIRDRNTLIAASLAGILILGLAWWITYRSFQHRQRLQTERMRNWEQAASIEKMQAMIQGEEKERTRIGRELHDGAMSQLMAINLNLTGLKADFPALEVHEGYQEIAEQVVSLSNDIHNTSHKLMPEVLLYGLAEAIRLLCEQLNNSQDVRLNFQLYDDIPPLDLNFSLSIYRIAQELIQNILKHAHATTALIQLNYTTGMLSLTVEDNGKGFIPNDLHTGAGLRNIRERIKELQGQLQLESDPGTGTMAYAQFDVHLLDPDLNL